MVKQSKHLGEQIYVPSEENEFIVSSIIGNVVKLVNFSSKQLLVIDTETLNELRIIPNVDHSGF